MSDTVARARTDPEADAATLATADLDLIGRVLDASNAALLVRVINTADHTEDPVDDGYAVYKPIRGERPLWDFPDGQLAYREVAAYLISRAGGWDITPPTVLRDGPHGQGSVQRWVTPIVGDIDDEVTDGHIDDEPSGASEGTTGRIGDPDGPVVIVVPRRELPDGWFPVLSGDLANGSPVVVAHADIPELASVAVFDAVLNNSDRKASHLLRDPSGKLWGVDHGVSLHRQDKLRTVLWGWAGEEIPEEDIARLDTLTEALQDWTGLRGDLEGLLTRAEIAALSQRVGALLRTGVFPSPHGEWPPVPWPPL